MVEDQRTQRLAEVFQALSDSNRLRILNLLNSSKHPICVNGLACNLGISQSAVSQHLKVLKNCRLVTVQKEGYFKHYAVNKNRLLEIRRMSMDFFGMDLTDK